MGVNKDPARCRSVTATLSTHDPTRVATLAKPPSESCIALASAGCTSTNGSGICAPSRALSPDRVMVCHWSRRRPVLRRSGNSLPVATLGAGGPGAIEARLVVSRIEAALHKEPPILVFQCFAGAQRPLHGIERVERVVADRG